MVRKPILAECFWVNLWEDNKVVWIQDGSGWIQDGRIQDGWHHQVEWEWMSLSQIELVWVRVRVEWECFWVNLREDNKVSESKTAVAESKMAEFKMADIIKLGNEWMSLSADWLNWFESAILKLSGVRVFLSESERR